jgi:hypothetical protein
MIGIEFFDDGFDLWYYIGQGVALFLGILVIFIVWIVLMLGVLVFLL